MKKTKHLKIVSDKAILVTTDVLGLYPSIPHEAGLRALKKVLNKRREKQISSEDLVKMAEFVLEKNYFQFNAHFKNQILGMVIGIKLAPNIHAFSWMRQKLNFKNHKNFNPQCGSDILTMFLYLDPSCR